MEEPLPFEVGKESKPFFSEEKKQKTFGPAVAMVLQRALRETQVFAFSANGGIYILSFRTNNFCPSSPGSAT